MATTFADAVTECRARGLGTSDCLAHVEPFCDGNPLARVVSGSGASAEVVFSCARPISPRKAATELKEALARVVDANREPFPWLLVVGGGVVLAGIVLLLVRKE